MSSKWEEVGQKELENLYYEKNMSDQEIAAVYGISKSKV